MPRAPRRALLLGALLLAAGALAERPAQRFALSAWSEFDTFRERHDPVTLPADAGTLGLRPVAFAVSGVGAVHGWYAPARNGAAVVVTHGSGGDRREVLDVSRALVRGGYGALLFDWPGHGESEGRITFGATERRTLQVAVGYAARQPDVAGGRVGVYGFSMGAFVAVQVAAVDRRVRAVALAAPPPDALAFTRHEYAAKGVAAQWGALVGDRLGGMHFDEPQPVAVVARIAPRPVLILTGTADSTVTPAMARALYAAAGEPKRLWLVEGAAHGGYERAVPDYGARVRAFFDAALLGGGKRGAGGVSAGRASGA